MYSWIQQVLCAYLFTRINVVTKKQTKCFNQKIPSFYQAHILTKNTCFHKKSPKHTKKLPDCTKTSPNIHKSTKMSQNIQNIPKCLKTSQNHPQPVPKRSKTYQKQNKAPFKCLKLSKNVPKHSKMFKNFPTV